MTELLLVSQSPRRRELLERAGIRFRVDTVKVSEIIEENLNWGEAIAAVARTKAEAYVQAHKHLKSQDIILLSADTSVILGGQALGKPNSSAEATRMLGNLSGKTHLVVTGIFMWHLQKDIKVLDWAETKVEFKELTPVDIENYVASGDPMDKAGAYGIQGPAAAFVKAVSGDIDTVIGLPVDLVKKHLSNLGMKFA